MDCTFGRGGHSIALLERVGSAGRVVGLDRDPQAVVAGRALAERDPRFEMVHAWFGRLQPVADELGISGRVDGIVVDLGVSSPQLDDASRGFSFRADAALDMRMDPSSTPSAAEWLARASAEEIAHVLKTYGEERYAKRIARRIVEMREHAPIDTTAGLADLVSRAVPAATGRRRRGARAERKHPATRTFLAIRMHVNRELEELERAWLEP